MIKNHKYFEMLISRYKDKDLDYNEIVELKEHLAKCKKCREFERQINSISSILQFSNVKTKKKHNNKALISIASIAAVIMISVISVNKIFINNKTEDTVEIIASYSMDDELIYNYDIPLSSYFEDDDNKYKNNDDNIMMSSYLSYLDK